MLIAALSFLACLFSGAQTKISTKSYCNPLQGIDMGNITYVLEWMETVYPDSLQQYQPERGKSNGNQDTLITILNPESWLFLKNSQGRAISDSTSSPDAGDGNPREERMHRILIRNKISETNLFNRVTAF